MNKDKNLNKTKESKFWKNKPITLSNSFISNSSKIVDLNEKFLYNTKNGHPLPEQMMWNIIQKSDEKNLSVTCDFLNTYYDKKNNIYFTSDFLNFILGERGFILSIVNKNNNAICGVVCVSIRNMIVFDKTREFAFPNFLCSHPKYRKKGIAETIMNELIRYLNMNKNIQQGIFPSDNKLAQPCTIMRKYYRPINYNKLCDAEFLNLNQEEKTINTIHNKFAISPKDLPSENYTLMTKEHMDRVFDLYNTFMSQYNVSCKYTKEELENLLLNNIVKSYVILENKDKIVDFVSYCKISFKCKDNKIINAGHVFLYSMLKEYGESMMTNLLKIMNIDNIDVAITNDDSNMMDTIMSEKYCDEDSDIETYEKIYEHKFVKKQKTYINLFNWECPFLTPDKVSLFII